MNINNLIGKRLLFGITSMMCVTVTTITLKYGAEEYIKLIGIIVGMFMTAQTVTDSIKISKNGNTQPNS